MSASNIIACRQLMTGMIGTLMLLMSLTVLFLQELYQKMRYVNIYGSEIYSMNSNYNSV
jgi:uncharacterized membrane protein